MSASYATMIQTQPDPALVEAKGVKKTYRRGGETVEVLQELDLTVPEGDFLALMGPSGSGKTTLMNLLGGIDRPSAGTITVGDTRIDNLNERALAKWRARHVGFV
ncbi:MAG: ATP-binding cassette domain-containing protein, partial [Gammaproteobacteria bacterium]